MNTVKTNNDFLIIVILFFLPPYSSLAEEPRPGGPSGSFNPHSKAREAELASQKLGRKPSLSNAAQQRLLKGEILIREIEAPASGYSSFIAIATIPASPREIMSVLRDYPSHSRFMPDVKEVSVHWKNNLAVVDETLATTLKTIRYRLNFLHYKDSVVEWEFVSGDIKDCFGSYKLFPINNGTRTLLEYRLNSNPGVAISDSIVSYFTKRSVLKVVNALRMEVVKRSNERGP